MGRLPSFCAMHEKYIGVALNSMVPSYRQNVCDIINDQAFEKKRGDLNKETTLQM